MKPVVSSLVALAIAIAPFSVMAKPSTHHKPHAAKVHHKDKSEASKVEAKDTKKDKDAAIVRVKATSSDHAAAAGKKKKPALHHAHNVDLGGAGHKEPKVDPAAGKSEESPKSAIVPASMMSKMSASVSASTHSKSAAAPAHAKKDHAAASAKKPASAEMPKLPNPNAGKASKGAGAEKAAPRKSAEKKQDNSDDGELGRDEEFAELVARIRGRGENLLEQSKDKDSKTNNNNKEITKAKTSPPPCVKDPVEIVRGPEMDRFELTKCDGSVAPLAIEHLSVLIRPGGAPRPVAPFAELAKRPGAELAQGIRRVDPRLVERIQSIVDHFNKPGAPAKIFVISGYRPASVGSMHSSGRAIDFRVEGAKNEDVVAFCKTLGDTGCGFYPNSSFVHVDVRDAGAGHVSWIDASGPGETPRYVATWPPPPVAARHIEKASTAQPSSSSSTPTDEDSAPPSLLRRRPAPLDREAAPDAVDDHPADVAH